MSEEKKKRRRPNKEAQAAIDAAAEKIRDEQMAAAPVKIVTDKKQDGMSFEQWWMVINKKLQFRPHMKEIIWADFKARGAGKIESEEKYGELLRLFGYTV